MEPEPSSRMVQETGAFSERSKRSVATFFPSTSSVTSFAARSVIGTPFALRTLKGTIT
jgi:hypothetical protein